MQCKLWNSWCWAADIHSRCFLMQLTLIWTHGPNSYQWLQHIWVHPWSSSFGSISSKRITVCEHKLFPEVKQSTVSRNNEEIGFKSENMNWNAYVDIVEKVSIALLSLEHAVWLWQEFLTLSDLKSTQKHPGHPETSRHPAQTPLHLTGSTWHCN